MSAPTSWRQPELMDTPEQVQPMRGPLRTLEFRSPSEPVFQPKEQSFKKPYKPANPVFKTLVQHLDLNCVKPQRAGVIILTVHNGILYVGMGLDSPTHDITDFAGGVTYKTDINVINGALREFREETLDIFDPITPEDIEHCPVVYDTSNLIIFVSMDIDPDRVSQTFKERFDEEVKNNTLAGKKYIIPEICAITWLTWEEFQHSIRTKGIMYSHVRKFLQRAGDFSYLL